MNGSVNYPRKIIKEVIFVMAKVIIQEFMNADENSELLIAIISKFE